jgi:aryl-alcohol dehydrogenase-like predicted oxidoreductase
MERIKQLCARHGWPAPVALQQQHSYLRPKPGSDSVSITGVEQLDWLRANDDVTLVAYSPILKGIYDDGGKRHGHWAMNEYEGPDADARLHVLTEVAAELGVTPNQLVVAWLMDQPSPRVIPLIGPRTPEQFEDALPALEVRLSAEQLERLDAAGA